MLTLFVAIGCTKDEDLDWDNTGGSIPGGSNSGNPGGTNSGTNTGTSLTGDLADFDVVINTAALEENETIPDTTDEWYDDYVEGYSPTASISISYDGSSATVSGAAEGVTVTTDGAHVTVISTVKGVAYQLSGATSDGSFKIYSSYKFQLTLNGVDITNPTGAAINNQGKRCYLVVNDGTTNTLTDGTSYSIPDGEDMKATLFSEGKLDFSGKGTLQVYSNCKNGIASDDYLYIRPGSNIYVKSTTNHGMKANDGIIVRGGVVNVEVSAAMAKAIKSDAYIQIDGGRVTAITTGASAYDSDDQEYKGCAAIKSDSIMVVNGGEVLAKSTGQGGKAISTDQTLTVNGGTIKAIASGNNYGSGNNSVAAKAIKADGDLTINGGLIMARASAHEAIETKGNLLVNNGDIAAYSSDDAINAAGNLTINDGRVYCYSTGNDGIDANKHMYVNGGVLVTFGATGAETGIDVGEQYSLYVNGGTLLGMGGRADASVSTSTCKQPYASLSGISVNSGTYLTVNESDGTCLFAVKMPRAYSGAAMEVSSSAFSSSGTYTIGTATSASGDEFFGYIANAETDGTSSLGSWTFSSNVYGSTGGNGGGMPGGGGGPGGWH